MAYASKDFENQAHRLLARWRIHGEWFDLGDKAELFASRVSICTASTLFSALGAIDSFQACPTPKGYTYNRWDESLGCEPFDDPQFFAAHARFSSPYCLDCDANALAIGEFYWVFSHVWEAAIRRSSRRPAPHSCMLCLGCLEIRIGRRLTPADFVDDSVNNNFDASKSQRLLDRSGRNKGFSGAFTNLKSQSCAPKKIVVAINAPQPLAPSNDRARVKPIQNTRNRRRHHDAGQPYGKTTWYR